VKFSIYKNQFDVHPVTQETAWDTLVAYFLNNDFPIVEDKSNYTHISMSIFDGYKNGQHAIEMWGLILDYDDGLSVDEAMERFEGFEYLLYTSYNHQRVKKKGVAPVDKFRIIFPFEKPCPADEWNLRKHFVTKMAPGVDPSSSKFVQCYCSPCTHEDNIDNTVMFHSKGSYLDWEMFPRVDPETIPDAGQANVAFVAEQKLKPDDIIRLKKGTIRAGDVDRHYQCYCPFHNDTSPGAFISKSAKGNVFLHCKSPKCCGASDGKSYYMEMEEEPDAAYMKWFLETRKKPIIEQEPTDKDDILIFDPEPDYVEPKTRAERIKLVENRCVVKWKSDIMLMYGFEGLGKSHAAVLFVRRGKKILFACDSNAQAYEQAESFKKNPGLRVQFIPGRQWTLYTKYNVIAEVTEEPNPWSGDRLDKQATKKKCLTDGISPDQFEEMWDDCQAPPPEWDEYDLIVTTHARVSSWGQIQATRGFYVNQQLLISPDSRIVPKNAIIFYDDPDMEDFAQYADWKDEYEDLKEPIKKTTIGKKDYAVRPQKYTMGYGFDNRIVFTTTEIIVREMIERQFRDVYVPPLMPAKKMLAGDITMIKTNLVSSKRDGFIPPLVERLRKEGYEYELIGDGMGAMYNLTNNKGQNTLINKDTIVEISTPRKEKSLKLCHEFGWEDSEFNDAAKFITLDQMHQAIGRNSGYRWSDLPESDRRHSIVVCEPQLAPTLLKHSRYWIENYIPDPTSGVSRKVDYIDGVGALCWYITNINVWLAEGRNPKVLSDVRDAFNGAPIHRRLSMKKRMLDAANNAIKQKKIVSEKLRKELERLVTFIEKLK